LSGVREFEGLGFVGGEKGRLAHGNTVARRRPGRLDADQRSACFSPVIARSGIS
jgi:hypothetical protein